MKNLKYFELILDESYLNENPENLKYLFQKIKQPLMNLETLKLYMLRNNLGENPKNLEYLA